MELLAGGPSLTPPFRKRVDASDATARRLLGHAAEISRLAAVYDALQDKAATVLQVRRKCTICKCKDLNRVDSLANAHSTRTAISPSEWSA
jgi:hypothetical protein